VHLGSARREGPLVQVACGATGGLLDDAELFGYEPGAFTGAHATHPGSLDAATGGTLVLGEIASLSSEAQARLQAFLETGVYRRLGGTEELTADARVVATSGTELRGSAVAGRFREDLYYQIEVLRIDLPPLRQRREDIPELAALFASSVCGGRSESVRFSPGALDRLRQHNWPGNVRELRRAVERAVATTPGDTIPAEAVDLSVGDDAPAPFGGC
jgi:DNA-binding NtrC family response regulator